MKRAIAGCMLACLLMAGGLVAQQRRQQDIDLQAAIRTETVDGDLQGAIKKYNEVASKYGKTDRAVAVSALVHVAECYQKLGSAQARTVYAQIVRDYADQPEAVAMARARIASPDAGTSPGSMTERVVMTTTGFGLRLNSVTPDGRFGVGGDASNGDLIVRDLATGAVTRLLKGTLNPRTAGGPATEGRYAASAIMSPDQRQVVFTQDVEPGNADEGQLWVIPNQPDGTPRLVTKNPAYSDVIDQEPLAWAPDGRSVFVDFWKNADQPNQMVWVSVPDGAVTVIKSFERGVYPFGRPQLSPDGRYIAYNRPPRAGAPGQSIFILAADGSGSEVAVTQTAGVNNAPVWTPDGRHVLFVSDRAGMSDLWAVPVRDGRADGAPSMLRRNIGPVEPIGLTRNGSLYYRMAGTIDSIRFAGSEGDSWVVNSGQGITGVAPSWSPDGKTLAFNRTKPGGAFSFNVMTKTLDTGEERVVAQGQDYGGAAPTWLPDGKSLLVIVGTDSSTSPVNRWMKSLARVDVTGQSPTKVLFTFDQREFGLNNIVVAPDGRSAYLAGRAPKGGKFAKEATYCLLKLNLDTQRVEEVAPLPTQAVSPPAGRIGLSPDASSLAYVTEDKTRAHVITVSVNGGAPREVFADLSAAVRGLAWTADGRGLLVGRREDANRWQIVRVSLESGAVQATKLVSDSAPGYIAVTADGSRLAFVRRANVAETKVLDNVLSALK